MTKRQKLQIEQSDLREKINALLGLDELTDEQRAEMEAHTNRAQELEPELRAAIVAEGAEEAEARGQFGNNGDGESAEVRQLLGATTLTDYLSPASAGAAIEGRAAELNAALGVPIAGPSGGVSIPWAMLEVRAFTSTGENDGSEIQRPILQRLFGPGVMDTLGVRMDSVPVGKTEWPLFATGIAPGQVVEKTAAADAVAATFAYANLRPKRLTGKYEFSHEAAASVGELEQALRRDLADAIKSKMSDLIINGAAVDVTDAATAANVTGFLATIGAPDDAAAEAAYADYAGAHASGIDGLHAEMETEVSSVIGTDVYQHAATVYQTGSGESGSEALKRRSMACRASSYIPDATASPALQSKGNIFHLSGSNGGGIMRGDSVAAIWPTLEIIRDIYSQASQGVLLTWVTLWDAKVAFRTAAYERKAFKLG